MRKILLNFARYEKECQTTHHPECRETQQTLYAEHCEVNNEQKCETVYDTVYETKTQQKCNQGYGHKLRRDGGYGCQDQVYQVPKQVKKVFEICWNGLNFQKLAHF